ncbi:MAG TPA: dephospho-CoA kinase [Acidimicrobiaceae bacterium]|nr:dephospho-CoA kinase [Acidimicrobiaceae bacterium]
MLAVGLTGGIGAGKSTVAQLLVRRGAVLVDADAIARQVVEPGRPALAALVERFGAAILGPDGTLDRAALAAVAFADPGALADLNAITHPAIATEMAEQRRAVENTDAVVLLDVPLLKPVHRDLLALDVVVVVDCAPDLALERLVTGRAMDRADARARMAAQPSREERLQGADLVIDNNDGRQALEAEVERVWAALTALAR